MNILKGLADKVKHTATKVFEASKSRIKSLKPHMEKLKPCVEKIKPYVAKIKSQLNKLKPYIEKAKSYFKTDAGKKVLVGLAVISTIAIVIVVASIAGSSENDNSNIEVAATVATTEASTGETTKIVKADTAIAETTTEEMATEEETTIEVIAVENLNISNEDLSGRKEVHRNQNQAQAQDPEPNVSGQSPLVSNTSTPLSSGNEISGLVYGIDISKWQGDIDWAKVKAAGYEFVMIKCGGRSIASHAQLYVDNRFKENIEGAIASGMQVGVYFFSQAVNEREAQEEASLVIELLKNYQITYPVAFDWETAWGYRTYNANISKTTFTNMVNVFCSMIAQAGYEPMVYGNYDDLNRFDVVSVASKYKIWYARWYYKYENTSALYVAGEATPNLNFPYQMWQYKSTGKVPGIYGDVDLNVAFFSYSADSKYEITVKNKNITTNIGTTVNLLDGVTAKNGAGKDISDSLVYEIKNSKGTVVSDSIAFNTSGTYTVTYGIKDQSDDTNTYTATLIVRAKPVITLNKNEIVYFNITDFADKTANDMAKEVQELIANNVLSAKDSEGKDIKANVTISYPTILYLEDGMGNKLSSVADLTDAVLSNGEYTITYIADDKKGLSSEAKLTLRIVDLNSVKYEFEESKANGADFAALLNETLNGNLTLQTEAIEVTYATELDEAIANKSFVAGDVYEVTYTLKGLDSNVYYKKCRIEIVADEEESTTETDTTKETGTEGSTEESTTGDSGTEETTTVATGE